MTDPTPDPVPCVCGHLEAEHDLPGRYPCRRCNCREYLELRPGHREPGDDEGDPGGGDR